MLSNTSELCIFYDSFNVEKMWKKNSYIDWMTGLSTTEQNFNNSYKTHCSSFVASVASHLNIPFLFPSNDIGTEGLANKQYDWLEEHGKNNFWFRAETSYDAHILANHGYFVVAVYKNINDINNGHIVIIRPHKSDKKIIERNGPKVCQAGNINSSSIDALSILDNFNEYNFFAHKCKFTVPQ
jgi:hypothetical protein